MARTKRSEIDVGAVVEIETAGRLMYAVCVYREQTYGSLWRIVDEVVRSRPTEMETFVQKRERFFAFSPIESVLGEDGFKYVGTVHLPVDFKKLPLFRWPIYRPGTNEIVRWKLWSGTSRSHDIAPVGAEHADLPILQITHPRALRERLETGWLPRDLPATPSPGYGSVGHRSVEFFIHVRDRSSVERALQKLRELGGEVELRGSDESQSIVARWRLTEPLPSLKSRVEALALGEGGTLEGWGIAVGTTDDPTHASRSELRN